jgi:hypothetical protein
VSVLRFTPDHTPLKYRVEAPITDRLRDFAPDLEKYKVVLKKIKNKNKESI